MRSWHEAVRRWSNNTWERVWTGFLALKPPPRSFIDRMKNVAFGAFLRKKKQAMLY
jgi:hypothetical protein